MKILFETHFITRRQKETLNKLKRILPRAMTSSSEQSFDYSDFFISILLSIFNVSQTSQRAAADERVMITMKINVG